MRFFYIDYWTLNVTYFTQTKSLKIWYDRPFVEIRPSQVWCFNDNKPFE